MVGRTFDLQGQRRVWVSGMGQMTQDPKETEPKWLGLSHQEGKKPLQVPRKGSNALFIHLTNMEKKHLHQEKYCS